MSQTRQLAAIMFTDIEGYTSLMQQDEKDAMEIRRRHRETFELTTEAYNGEIIQYYGDGTLSVFKSTIEAVKCAIDLQIAYRQAPSVPVRIGIHVGDIIRTESDIIGDAVNVTSRIESLGVAGSVLISDKVNDSLRNKHEIQTAFIDIVEFKNVKKAIPIFAIANDNLVIPHKEDLEGKIKAKGGEKLKKYKKKIFRIGLIISILMITGLTYVLSKTKITINDTKNLTIAVLPFEDLNGDDESRMFTDGITEDIITHISKIQNLQVISRASAMFYKDSDKQLQQIAKELNVNYILEGSVRVNNNKVRINANLVDVENDKNLWANNYDNTLDEIFQIQSSVSSSIADALEIKLSSNEQSRLENLPTQNADAYLAYKQGQMYLNRGGGKVEELKQAEDYFKESIKLDPEFCRAYVGLTDTYVEYIYWGREAPKVILEKASSPALTALAINSDDGGSYGALGALSFYKFEKETAIRYLEKALEINPSYVGAYDKLAWIRLFDGDVEGAVALFKKVIELDPLSTKYTGNIAFVYAYNQQYEEGLKALDEKLVTFPNDNILLWMKGNLLALQGKYHEAVQYFSSRSAGQSTNWMLGYTYAKMGMKEDAERILNYQLEKNETTYVPPYMIATIYMGLGKDDKALEWLEKDYESGGLGLFFWGLKRDVKFNALRDNPRFTALLDKIK